VEIFMFVSAKDVIREKCPEISDRCHVSELHGGPLPAAGFAAHYGHGRHALHGEGEEDQQRDGAPEGEIAADGLLQVLALLVSAFHAVDSSQSSDDNFAGGERSDQADADFPVEAQGADQRLDRVAGLAYDARLDARRLTVMEWQVAKHPEDNRNAEDH